MQLRVRYFQDSTPADEECRESAFIRRELDMEFPAERTALVLVDMWNVHFIRSWIERAEHISREFVIPAMDAARDAGLTIVHAPCPEVAMQYPDHLPSVPPAPPQPSSGPDWPPHEFRSRSGEYAAYRGPRDQPPGIATHWDKVKGDLSMSPLVDVRPNETVVATGRELHHVLAKAGIYHTIYAGFAANWCLMGRDYGIRAMSRYGYHMVVLRDCTTGVEFPDTIDDNLVTELVIREVEQQYGFSASNEDFREACRA
jgi:nicotinamidase-related amidase